MTEKAHFLVFGDLSAATAADLVARAAQLKAMGAPEGTAGETANVPGQPSGQRQHSGVKPRAPMTGKVQSMLFFKPSTRTRVSFEAGMGQLGGSTVYMEPGSLQVSRGEPISDTARVISSMCDVVVIRTHDHGELEEFASYSSCPVVNALTSLEHPCQVLADVMTYMEARGPIRDRKVAWVGDANNVCRSWMAAAGLFGFDIAVAAPRSYDVMPESHQGLPRVSFVTDPSDAVADADCVVTDVWCSMGDEDIEQRLRDFAGYTVDAGLMAKASPEAVFMHCLPAHRGEEVTAGVIDGPQSVVWAEAENRMHAQKALLEHLVCGNG